MWLKYLLAKQTFLQAINTGLGKMPNDILQKGY